MARTAWMDLLGKAARASRAAADDTSAAPGGTGSLARRTFLSRSGRLAVAAAASALPGPAWALPSRRSSLDVGIVGAGLAGLACADSLARYGIAATVYEAAPQLSGRCASLRNQFPGQVAERGGEFIDNHHKTMLAYAKRFGLAVEDVSKQPGAAVYYFGGQSYTEAVVVDELRAFIDAMRNDLRLCSGSPTADSFTPYDEMLDYTTLAAYLDGQNSRSLPAGPVARAAITATFENEYGLRADEQSALNFLLFIHADKRSKFTPYGVFSDERYHVVNGNDQIVQGLAADLINPINFGQRLVAVSRLSDGRVELTFASGLVRRHQLVVLTLPFSVLRLVTFVQPLPTRKRHAIDHLGYGTNAKTMVGFDARPWFAQAGSTGESFSDLVHCQTTWETNPIKHTTSRAVLTDYASGVRGASLDKSQVQAEATAFLGDLEQVFPGSMAAASRNAGGSLNVHMAHWPSNPYALGSYTCYRPGQFTTIAGLEGTPVDNIFFAGEHTNSFYEWQGFMEGAALSGLDAAVAIVQAAKVAG